MSLKDRRRIALGWGFKYQWEGKGQAGGWVKRSSHRRADSCDPALTGQSDLEKWGISPSIAM